MTTAPINRISGVCPLFIQEDGLLWAAQERDILCSNDGENFKIFAHYKTEITNRMLGLTILGSRLFRLGLHTLIPLSDESLVGIIRGSVIKLDVGQSYFRQVFSFPKGSRPLNFCLTPDGRLYFGEYFGNQERDAVNIYASTDSGNSWQVVYRFPAGDIRHVHGIFYDHYRDGCWVLTGDSDKESRILFTKDHFQHLETLASGQQSTRAVTLIPLEDGLLVPTDTPLEQNFIQWLNLQSGKLEQLAPVPGSVFYSGVAGPYTLFSTVVEPSTVNRCRHATLWFSKNGVEWRELYRQKKDFWSMKFFQYGALVLPQGRNAASVAFAYGQALKRDSNCMLVWDLDAAWKNLNCK